MVKTASEDLALARLQEQFQSALLTDDERILTQIRGRDQTKREQRLGIYRDAYILRLIEFVEHDHDMLHAYLGDDQFNALAEAYARANPSHYRSARHFCTHLPEFLRRTAPYDAHPELADLAALEKALNDAFDAPDERVMTLADLAAVPPEGWGELVLRPHPSVYRLAQVSNAAEIWAALREEKPPPHASRRSAGRWHIIVWRNGGPKFRTTDDTEAITWDRAAQGVSFGGLCELLAEQNEAELAVVQVAGFLRGWIEAGMLSAR
jgi:hypothetical protein